MQTLRFKIVAGFVSGAMAATVFHQGMYAVLSASRVTMSGTPWNLALAPNGIPILVNQMFWSGLWGVVYAFLVDHIPGGRSWLKGLMFGLAFPMFLGSWLIFAWAKHQPIFAGLLIDGDLMRLRQSIVLAGVSFGIGLGLIYETLMVFKSPRSKQAA